MDDLLYVKQALLPVKYMYDKIAEMLGLQLIEDYLEHPEDDEDVVDRQLTEVVLKWFRKSYSTSSGPDFTWRNVVIVIAAKEGGNNTQHALVVAKNHKGKYMHLHKETVFDVCYCYSGVTACSY